MKYIKDWYLKTFDDELGKEIADDLTFESFVAGLTTRIKPYCLIGVGDSVIRERIMAKSAEYFGVELDDIYYVMNNRTFWKNGEFDKRFSIPDTYGDAVQILTSCLAYGCKDLDWETTYKSNKRFLDRHVDALGEDTMEYLFYFLQTRIKEVRPAGTDSDGVEYNHIVWED